jgi:KDO2-lipid IV(A) lauroyltransferase
MYRLMKKVLAKIIRGLMYVLAQLPLRVHYFFGDVMAWLLRCVFHYRTNVVWMNLARSFPDCKYSDLKPVYKDFYKHIGEIAAEAIWFSGSSYKRLNKAGIVTVKNPEVIAKMYESSPSVTVMCSHCGNWEILGGFYGYLTKDGFVPPFDETALTVVYKRLSSEVSDKIFAWNRVNALEKDNPDSIVESSNILRFCIRNRDKKRIYGYPADQTPYKGMGRHDIGLFMNQKTYAMTGSLGVACKLSHSVVYMKMKHVARGKYEWEFIPICDDASKHTQEELIRIYYDLLEQEIRETPHNWLWSHNRWKIW